MISLKEIAPCSCLNPILGGQWNSFNRWKEREREREREKKNCICYKLCVF